MNKTNLNHFFIFTSNVHKSIYLLIILQFISVSVFAQQSEVDLSLEYFKKGDLEKAWVIFQKLENEKQWSEQIHEPYLEILYQKNDFRTIERFLKKQLKNFPDKIDYRVDWYLYTDISDQEDKKNIAWKNLETIFKSDYYAAKNIGEKFTAIGRTDLAKTIYGQYRKENNQPTVFSFEIAGIHRANGEKKGMIEEYLLFSLTDNLSLQHVKYVLQSTLEETDYLLLEEILIGKIQKNPAETVFSDLLIWLYIQLHQFDQAFLQSKAYEKRTQGDGSKILELASLALENRQYDQAIEMYDYVSKNYTKSLRYFEARNAALHARELKIKNSYPILWTDVQWLIQEYNAMIFELGNVKESWEAQLSIAGLYAFYGQQTDSAKAILQRLIANSKVSLPIKSESKLLLGDIFLLTGEPWESTLLYSQVEKANKMSPLAYEAKLRNARLHYFNGDFALAKSHLDILKLATTREISNDAIDISLFINENIILDTADAHLKKFATCELLIFQNKKAEAIQALKQLAEEEPTHSIVDQIWWLLAKLHRESGEFLESEKYLQQIVQQFSFDILADDALFLLGELYEKDLNDKQKAMDSYSTLLRNYQGSMFVAAARQRFRILRGDVLN